MNDIFSIYENGIDIKINEFIKANPRLNSTEISIRLDKHPDIAKQHIFKITVELKNGEIFQALTEEVIFQ